MSDSELVRLSSEGDEKAFREILARYRQKILAICLRMLRNRTEAEEAAQDSFVKIYLHLNDFDQSRDFSAWAAGITMNECRDRLRKRSRFQKVFRELDDRVADDGRISSEEEMVQKKRLEVVEEAIEQLPEKLREVLVLKAYSDYSYEEIASILKIRIGTVMSRLHRSREKLTEYLRKGSRP